MDGRRFDDLTRALRAGTSRRRVLAGLAGAALGLVGLGRARADVSVGAVDYTGWFCGGIAGVPCPDGYACVDDVGDSCDPAAAGADCTGVCVPIPSAGACAAVLCVEGTYCCDVCGEGTCVPLDQPCPQAFCAGEPCNGVVCGEGEFCCNYSCSICAPIGGACIQVACLD